MPHEVLSVLIVSRPTHFDQYFWDSPEGRCLTCGTELENEKVYHACKAFKYLYLPHYVCAQKTSDGCLRHLLLDRPVNYWPIQFRPEDV